MVGRSPNSPAMPNHFRDQIALASTDRHERTLQSHLAIDEAKPLAEEEGNKYIDGSRQKSFHSVSGTPLTCDR